MATHSTLSALFTDIADAIREKDGTSAAIVADEFPDRIAAISGQGQYQSKTVTPTTSTQVVVPDTNMESLNGSGTVDRVSGISVSHGGDLSGLVSGQSYRIAVTLNCYKMGSSYSATWNVDDEFEWNGSYFDLTSTAPSSIASVYLTSLRLTATTCDFYFASSGSHGAEIHGGIYVSQPYDALSSVTVNPIPSDYVSAIYKTLFNKGEVSTGALQNVMASYSFIPSYAFAEYSVSSALFFPNVTTVNNGAFFYNSYLSSIQINSATTIGDRAFEGCVNLSNAIANSVVTIGNSAFKDCMLSSIMTFPSLTYIGDNAFENCASLGSIPSFFASSVQTIGNEAFKNCLSLVDVGFPNATEIGAGAFSGCASLINASFPAATVIGDDAFNGCTALRVGVSSNRLVLSAATSIGSRAFMSCISLQAVLAQEVRIIGASAFYGCVSLATITADSATSVGAMAFYQCSNLQDAVFPLVGVVNPQTFALCSKLSMVILSSANLIGQSAFSGCTSLKSVNLPSASTIGMSAFRGCTGLTVVSMPKARVISSYAFSGCTGLVSVYLLSTVPTQNTGGTTTFPMTGTWSIYVPRALYASYRTTTALGWVNYSSRLVSV